MTENTNILEENLIKNEEKQYEEDSTESEDLSSKEISQRRQPYNYPIPAHVGASNNLDVNESANFSRYRYYAYLDSNSTKLVIPDHVLPPSFFLPLAAFIKPNEEAKQSSIITIFAMWNCMVGTSLLSMPWAIHQAGLFGGIGCLVTMGLICCYTAFRIIKLQSFIGIKGSDVEFSDLCNFLLGKWAHVVSIVSSLLVLLGGTIVYWILMSNFMYHSVLQIYDIATVKENMIPDNHNDTHAHPGVVCVLPIHHHEKNNTQVSEWSTSSNITYDSKFEEIWNLHKTVPIFLVILVFPLINFKSPTFFTKFNALGAFSVMFLILVVCLKASKWGFHVSFSIPDSIDHVPCFKTSFTVLTGILALAYFIHNCIISIMKNQENPQNNVRDVGIAYALVFLTYMCIGVLFYLAFPLEKDCIDENLLNNFGTKDVLAYLARFFLLLQMLTVYPLLQYVFRVHFMLSVFGSVYPRFVGAFCGFVYIFALPSVTHIAALNYKSVHAPIQTILHSILVVIGFANLISQFFV
ncbi:Sodium-coupled neutral amino acid transporter 9 [Nymphon striatum]|nr:Sodium-coupled neutral amino acid transporter 9 [Nymphon striatum]